MGGFASGLFLIEMFLNRRWGGDVVVGGVEERHSVYLRDLVL